MIIIKKILVDKIMINYKIDLINHSYFILVEIQKLDSQSKKLGKKTCIVNIYDNQIKRCYI